MLEEQLAQLRVEKARIESDRDELSRQQGQYKAVIARVSVGCTHAGCRRAAGLDATPYATT